MVFEGIDQGPFRIRTLTDSPGDVAIMSRWLSDERVLEFYEGRDNPFDEEAIRHKFIGKLDDSETPCLVEYEGQPIGYLQFYPVQPEARAEYGFSSNANVYGMDQFIGEPSYWNRGIGTQMIRTVLAYLFRVRGAETVVLDPVITNLRAIRSYEKCGFRKVKILRNSEFSEGKWHDAWLMAVTPETFIAD